ncbi:MAG: polyprenyl synthetase family protein [Myxococcota bacterium]
MMQHINSALTAALSDIESQAPPKLASAINHAVFPGGARIRPRLCHAVAHAAGSDCPPLVSAVATSLELLHCASLVHDDLPCFDDADTRRGLPSVHRAFGEPLAVLAGDALIVLAFESLGRASAKPERLPLLLAMIAESAGAARGLVAGQGWESEPEIPLAAYHQAKTGSLFVAATRGGALAAGHDPEPWRALGDFLGEAYQVADDLLDACAEEAGKPLGQDAELGRPSAVAEHGIEGAVEKLRELVDQAAESVPSCGGASPLRDLVRKMAERLVPASLRQTAA